METNWTELINDAKKGDQKAQGQLIVLTQAKLLKFCILLGQNRELAEDLCQDVYIKAFRSLDKVEKPNAFLGWLYQIAKNSFIDFKRSQKETVPEDSIPEEGTEPGVEIVLQVQKALSQFEPEDRFLLLLIELEGMSYQEAAEMTGKTEDSVRSKLHRLKQTFVKNFK